MDKILLTARYVEGDLNEQEYREFETVVKYDTELQEYVDYYKAMNDGLSGQLKDALGISIFKKPQIVPHTEEVYVREKITYTTDHLYYLTIALIMAIGLFIWKPWTPDLYNDFKVNEQEVFADLNAAPYQNFNLAVFYLKNKQPYEAKLVVSKVYMKNPEDLRLGYLYSIMLLENNSVETINTVLTPLLKSNTYKDAAAYLMALSHLKKGNTAGCEEWLNKINQRSSFYNQASGLKLKLTNQSA